MPPDSPPAAVPAPDIPTSTPPSLIVLFVAFAFYTQYDTIITVWLSDFYPSHQTGL